MPKRFQSEFPEFYARLTERDGAEMENILAPATGAEIAEIERDIGVPLPSRTSVYSAVLAASGFSVARYSSVPSILSFTTSSRSKN